MLIGTSDGKDIDAIIAVTKVGAQPVVLDAPMLVSSGEARWICSSYVEVSLVVFESMTDEEDLVALDLKGCDNFLEDVMKRK